MHAVTEDKRVSDMTIGELKTLIRDAIYELIDPDYGLELRPEVEEMLRESIKQKERGEGVSLEEVKRQLGLK